MRLQTHPNRFSILPISLLVLAIILVMTRMTLPPVGAASTKSPNPLFQILGTTPLQYNYDDLIGSKGEKNQKFIIINVRTTSKLMLSGTVVVEGVTDLDGQGIDLIFTMVNDQNEGKFVKIDPSKNKNPKVQFQMEPTNRPKPGRYKGEVTLTAEDPQGNRTEEERTRRFNILVTVPNPGFELIDAENLQYDFSDLIASGTQSLVRIIIRNKKEDTLKVNAILKAQQGILSTDGNSLTLMFQRVDGKGRSIDPEDKPEEIGPGETVSLYFKGKILDPQKEKKPHLSPAPGIYKAFLVVTTTDGRYKVQPKQPLSIYVPSKDMVEAKTDVQAARAWLLKWPKRLSLSWLGRKSGIGLVVWDILFYLFVIFIVYILRKLWFAWVLYRRRHHLGTIEIETLTDATERGLKCDGLKALLKATLENLGLAPPNPQPVAFISSGLSNIITKSSVQETGIVSALGEVFIFLWGLMWPRLGHKITLTFRGDTNTPIEAIVEIKNALTGRSEEIKGGILAKCPDEAVRKVAHCIYLHEINQKHVLKHTPEWERLTNLEGFELYQVGKGKQEKGATAGAIGDYQTAAKFREEAIDAYKEAAKLEVNNALICMGLGSALEEGRRFLEAMEVYIHVVKLWPKMLTARYRLAATLSYDKKVMKEWGNQKEERQQALEDSLRQFIKKDRLTEPQKKSLEGKSINRRFFLDLSDFQWKYLEKQWPRGKYRRRVEVAHYCTVIQMNQTDYKSVQRCLDDVDDMLSSRGIDWVVVYNGACAYSLALASLGEREKRDQEYRELLKRGKELLKEKHGKLPNEVKGDKDLLRKVAEFKESVREYKQLAKYEKDWSNNGVKWLKQVIANPESASSRNWLLQGDPDLESLRGCEAFKEWQKELLMPELSSRLPSSGEPLPDFIAQGWQLLSIGARVRLQLWEARQEVVIKWPPEGLRSIHLGEVYKWYNREKNIWMGVVNLAKNNGDSKSQKTFLDALMQDTGPVEMELPPPTSKLNSTKVQTYKDCWQKLAENAKTLHQEWHECEEEILSAIPMPDYTKPVEYISSRIKCAVEVWRLLETSAKDLLEKTS